MLAYSFGRKLGSDVDMSDVFMVTVKGSYGDGDSKTEETELNQEEFVNALERILYLKSVEDHWSNGLEELMEIDERTGKDWAFLVPLQQWGDYCGSLKKLDVVYFDNEGTKYDVNVFVDFYSDAWNF